MSLNPHEFYFDKETMVFIEDMVNHTKQVNQNTYKVYQLFHQNFSEKDNKVHLSQEQLYHLYKTVMAISTWSSKMYGHEHNYIKAFRQHERDDYRFGQSLRSKIKILKHNQIPATRPHHDPSKDDSPDVTKVNNGSTAWPLSHAVNYPRSFSLPDKSYAYKKHKSLGKSSDGMLKKLRHGCHKFLGDFFD